MEGRVSVGPLEKGYCIGHVQTTAVVVFVGEVVGDGETGGSLIVEGPSCPHVDLVVVPSDPKRANSQQGNSRGPCLLLGSVLMMDSRSRCGLGWGCV